jgi:NAD(P)-dependent dehydrogenase (short-subunit alcohol dehydrogenase family)
MQPMNTKHSDGKVWWITGASSGLGRVLAEEVLAAGQRVVASARRVDELREWAKVAPDRVLVLPLDVEARGAIEGATQEALARFGRIDVLANNAGYGLLGAVEEVSEAEARAQMETNFFGALWMTQAVLPHMRARREGCLLQISSVAGVSSTAGVGLYNASKFALEGFSEALWHELAGSGVRVVIVEPGPFRTRFLGSSLRRAAKRIDAYAATAHATEARLRSNDGRQEGDPVKAARVLIAIAEDPAPPLRLPLGQWAHDRTQAKAEWLLRDRAAWAERSLPTAFDAAS